MKVLTVWQPFASLLVAGIKENETRSWPTEYRGELLIHAAKKPVKEVMKLMSQEAIKEATRLLREAGVAEKLDDLPTGCIVGFANLVDVVKTGETEVSDTERLLGDWTRGRYGWKMTDPVRFHEKIEAKGQQGLWNYKSNTLNNIMRHYW